MMGIQVSLEHAQEVKEYLIEHNLLDKDYLLLKRNGTIIFPIVREFGLPFEFEAEFVDAQFEEQDKNVGLKDELKKHFTQEEMESMTRSYDIVGSIAIIEIPDDLEEHRSLIGQKILDLNKPIRTVLRKIGGHEGPFRTQPMECIAGEDIRETTVIENGVKLKVNVEETYYSVRMASERSRIAGLVSEGESILCLFSGVAPYPCVLSRHTKAKEIVGIEINPAAHELGLENVAHNRCTNVHLLEGDAHEILHRFARDKRRFDRITMPLPHTAQEFLDGTISVCAKSAVIHYYSFEHENEFENAVETLRSACRRNHRELKEYCIEKAGQHAPRIWRICVDAVLD